ncbi:hypothetical protein BS17DRAFT_468184 [Gyrodon lividus]|nr:hypothetical protein BS17DRAFT_468184 [Gyrodon lividus]
MLQKFHNHLISALLGCDTIFASMTSSFPPPRHNHWTKKPPGHCLTWPMLRCCHAVRYRLSLTLSLSSIHAKTTWASSHVAHLCVATLRYIFAWGVLAQ